MRSFRVSGLRVLVLSASLAFGSVIACGDSDRPSDLLSPRGDASADGASSDGAPSGDGGGPGDGSPSDGGSDGSVEQDAGPTVCKANLQAGNATALPISTALDDRFGSVTFDELSIAWSTNNGGTVTIHYADRTVATDPFSTAQTLTGSFAFDRATLNGSGLALYVVAADGKSVTRFERGDRTQAFVEGAPNGEFDNLLSALGNDEKIGDLVLGFGGQSLYYSVYGGASVDTVRRGTRLGSGSPWDASGTLTFPELKAQGAMRRRPTGAGSDSKTLFWWDEVSNTEKMGLLKGSIGFFNVQDLGARAFASPSDDCSKLYYSGSGDLQTAPTN